MSQSFDLVAAQETLRLLQFAHDRWSEIFAGLIGKRFEDANSRVEVLLRVRGPAVETAMWARSLDDWCRGLPNTQGQPEQPVLPGYEVQRAQAEGLLDAARYVTNRSLHQLLAMMKPWGTMQFPLNTRDIFNTFGGIRWLTEGHLPSPDQEHKGQQRFRQQYVKHMAGQEIGPHLDRLREWFETLLAPNN